MKLCPLITARNCAIILFFLLAGCSLENPNPTATDVSTRVNGNPTSTPAPTNTPKPTQTPTPQPTKVLEPTKSPTPTIIPTVAWPLTLGTVIPDGLQVISPANVAQLQAIVQWGDGKIYQAGFLSHGDQIYTVTTTGVQVYDGNTLQNLLTIQSDIMNQAMVRWAISPDEKWFALLNHEFKLSIWSLNDARLKDSIQFQNEYLGCPDQLKFTPDSKQLVIFGECNLLQYDSRLTILDVEKGKTLMHEEGRGRGLFTPDGEIFITFPEYGKDPPISLWRAPNYTFISDLKDINGVYCPRIYHQRTANPWPSQITDQDQVDCLAVSPNGKLLAVDNNKSTNVYKISSLEKVNSFSPGRPEFSQDGRFLIINTGIFQSKVYDLSTGAALALPTTLTDVSIFPDQTRLIGENVRKLSNGEYRFEAVVLYDLNQGKRLSVFDGYNAAYFSQTGQTIAVFTDQNQAYKPPLIVNATDGSVMLSLDHEKQPVISQDGHYLATISVEGTSIYDLQTGTRVASVKGTWPQFTADSKSLLTIGPARIYRWSVESGELLASAPFPVTPLGLEFNLAGQSFIEKSAAGTRAFTTGDMTEIMNFPPDIVVSPSDKYFAVDDQNEVKLNRSDTHELLFSFKADKVELLKFSPDDAFLAVVRSGKSIDIYDVSAGKKINTIIAEGKVDEVQFSPDRTRLYAHTITGTGRGVIAAWMIDSAKRVLIRNYYCDKEFDSGVRYSGGGMALSPDGQTLAYISDNCETTILDLRSLGVLQTLQDWGDTLALSPQGQIIAISSKSGGIRLWDVDKAKLLKTIVDNPVDYQLYQNMLQMIGGYVPQGQTGISLTFSPDGRFLGRTADGIATLWGIKP